MRGLSGAQELLKLTLQDVCCGWELDVLVTLKGECCNIVNVQ